MPIKFDLEKIAFPSEVTPGEISKFFEEVKKAMADDPFLKEYTEMEEPLDSTKGPNYTPTVFFTYSISSG